MNFPQHHSESWLDSKDSCLPNYEMHISRILTNFLIPDNFGSHQQDPESCQTPRLRVCVVCVHVCMCVNSWVR